MLSHSKIETIVPKFSCGHKLSSGVIKCKKYIIYYVIYVSIIFYEKELINIIFFIKLDLSYM